MNKFIPQVEPNISDEDVESVANYLKSGGWITEHGVSDELANNISNKVKREYSTFVPNGTIAIYLALLSQGLKNGKKIAVPNLTMIATVNAVLWANCIPILIDVDENLCMSFEKLKKIDDLDGVLFVPLNGRTGDGLKIEEYCKEKNIPLIEDSAHALGSNYKNKPCGSLGDVSIFSFTPHKIITMGQGGLILTDKEAAFEKIQKLKLFNRSKDKNDWHDGFGLNFKITDLQASLGLSQFKKIEEFIGIKNFNFSYVSQIKSDSFYFLNFKDYEVPWFNDVVFNSEKRKVETINLMKENLIETRNCYPALNKQIFLNQYTHEDLKYSEEIFSKILWLPSSTNLTLQQLDVIKSHLNY